MAQENMPPEENELNFPEGSELVIEEILKKYGLEKTHKEGFKRIFKAPTLEERKNIINDLPGAKISQLLRRYQSGELILEAFPALLEKSLNVSSLQSEEITKELKEKILAPSKSITEEETPKTQLFKPKRPDSYREPIE